MSWRQFLPQLRKVAMGTAVAASVLGVLVLLFVLFINSPNDGYYQYDDQYYYCYDGSWYQFNQAQQNWARAGGVDSGLKEHYTDYWTGSDYDSGLDVTDFSRSEYYSVTDEEEWKDDWDDDDFDWDSGSDWDSGDTDWDSDW